MHAQGDEAHSANACHLLTSEVAELIRLREDKYPSLKDKVWSCNHCTVHFANFVVRRDSLKHVKDVHDIARPREGTDIIHQFGPEALHAPRRPVAIAESPAAELRCVRCPGRGSRLYCSQLLAQHLLDRHRVSEPTSGSDFVRIDVILRSTVL